LMIKALSKDATFTEEVFIRPASFHRFCLYAVSRIYVGLRPCRNKNVDTRYRFMVGSIGGYRNVIHSVAYPDRCFDARLQFRFPSNDGFQLRLSRCANVHDFLQVQHQQFSIPAVGQRGMIKLPRQSYCVDASFEGMQGYYQSDPVSIRRCRNGWKHRQIFKVERYQRPKSVKRLIRVSAHLDLCIDVFHGSAQLAACGDGFKKSQQFLVPASGHGPIRWAANIHKCLDASRKNADGRHFVQLRNCNRYGFYKRHSQSFQLPQADGQIRKYPSEEPSRCFDLRGPFVRVGRHVLFEKCGDFGKWQNFLLTGPGRLV